MLKPFLFNFFLTFHVDIYIQLTNIVLHVLYYSARTWRLLDSKVGFPYKVFKFLTLRNMFSYKAVEVIDADFSITSQPAKSFSVCSTKMKEYQFRKRRQAFSFHHKGEGSPDIDI